MCSMRSGMKVSTDGRGPRSEGGASPIIFVPLGEEGSMPVTCKSVGRVGVGALACCQVDWRTLSQNRPATGVSTRNRDRIRRRHTGRARAALL